MIDNEVNIKNTISDFAIHHMITEADAKILLFKLGDLIDRGYTTTQLSRLFEDIKSRRLSERSKILFKNVK